MLTPTESTGSTGRIHLTTDLTTNPTQAKPGAADAGFTSGAFVSLCSGRTKLTGAIRQFNMLLYGAGKNAAPPHCPGYRSLSDSRASGCATGLRPASTQPAFYFIA